MDLGIEVILELFSHRHLERLFEEAFANDKLKSDNALRIYQLRADYLKLVDPVVQFLQSKNPSLARLICSDHFLPEASRFENLDDMEWAFGNMGIQDKAKHFATLFLEDLSDFIVECIDPHFGFSRYAERLARSANDFDELYDYLTGDASSIDIISFEILHARIKKVQPKLICFSAPFPGNVYSAFRCAQEIKEHYPDIKIALGGGFANTELRSVNDPRVFDFFDFICLDDGELPIELIHHAVCSGEAAESFFYKRTFLLEDNMINYRNDAIKADYKQSELGTPDYSDLLLDSYISVIEMANPMHSLWSDGRWNKLTMAHGCYWGKCTFCDISLDYIKNYEPIAATLLVDRMEEMIEQTGENGFHFVDEAAPPSLMKSLALEILKRGLVVTWWTNIRFEKNFTKDLCVILQASGCIAVSGGLEVAADRLLALIDKGVTVEQVAKVTRNFTESNIMVHAYLMYGYPTQSIQETVDSLEMVRQMFELGILQSGFWHQFALTAHSPIGINPEAYGIKPKIKTITFANNDIDFEDELGIDHSMFAFGLKKSLFNYMHGVGLDFPLKEWFDFKIPKTGIDNNFIEKCLEDNEDIGFKPNKKMVWLGNDPVVKSKLKKKKGNDIEFFQLCFYNKTHNFEVMLEADKAHWLLKQLELMQPTADSNCACGDFMKSYEDTFDEFLLFWYSESMDTLRENGLLLL